MRKLKRIAIGLSVVLALLLSDSCASQDSSGDRSDMSAETANRTTQETLTIRYQIDPLLFSSRDQLVESSDLILTGVLVDVKTVRLDLAADGYVDREKSMEANVSSFMVDVTRGIKGDVKAGSTIQIDARLGGEADGIHEVYDPPLPSPEKGKPYLFFLTTPDAFKGKTHFQIMFCGSFDGFYHLDDETVIPQHAHVCLRALPFDELERAIRRILIND